MAEQNDVKSFLYAWLGKKKCTPEYNIRPAGAKHRQRFLCELRGKLHIYDFHFTKKTYFSKFSFSRIFSLYLVPGYDYSACGNSTSKKDSQANAAKDFIQYLLRQGQMLPNEVPDGCGMDQGGGAATGPPPMGGLGLNQRPVFQHG